MLLLLGVLLVKFDESQDVHKLVLLHADLNIFNIQCHCGPIVMLRLQAQLRDQLDWLEQVGLCIVRDFGCACWEELVELGDTLLLSRQVSHEIQILRLIVNAEVFNN